MCIKNQSFPLKDELGEGKMHDLKGQKRLTHWGARKKKVSAMSLWVTQLSLIEGSLRSNLSLSGKSWPLDLREKMGTELYVVYL